MFFNQSHLELAPRRLTTESKEILTVQQEIPKSAHGPAIDHPTTLVYNTSS